MSADQVEHEVAAAAGEEPAPYELTNRDREMLEFERLHWKYSGTRESEVFARWGIHIAAYTQRVLWLIDQPAALEYDPVNVLRQRRLRDLRRAQRRGRC